MATCSGAWCCLPHVVAYFKALSMTRGGLVPASAEVGAAMEQSAWVQLKCCRVHILDKSERKTARLRGVCGALLCGAMERINHVSYQ